MKRRVDSFMAYGCDSCGKGFRMFLETGLEEINDGPAHKPVPFFIKCPFCGNPQCHDLAFRKYRLKQHMNPKGIPYFANRRDQDSGVPTNMEFAKVEFTRNNDDFSGMVPEDKTRSKTMKYIRVNYVDAEPMKFGEFKTKFPLSGGANQPRPDDDEGYVITYRKGEPNEYVSWCPKAEFDAVSRPIDGMTFGMAIEAMKNGKKVARRGWNGKGMYVWVMPGSTITNCPNITDPHLKAISDANGGTVAFTGSIRMKTATGEVLTGWLASQTDMLCEDWVIVE